MATVADDVLRKLVLRADERPVAVKEEPPMVRYAQRIHPASKFGIAGRLSRIGIYGKSSDLIAEVFEREYHSPPHTHDCEQMSICLEGEIWMFVEDEGFHLRVGDMHRVPRGAVHWAWNRSNAPCRLITSHSPRLLPEPYEAAYTHPAFRSDEGTPGQRDGVRSVYYDFSDHIEVEEHLDAFEGLVWSPFATQLLFRSADFPPKVHGGERAIATGSRDHLRLGAAQDAYPEAGFQMGGLVETKCVRGNEGDIGLFTRRAGYHSPPHIDPIDEQLNYGVTGSCFLYVEDQGFEIGPGDFLRVPSNSVHWAWNRSNEPSTWVETHIPSHITRVIGLYQPNEKPQPKPAREGGVVNAGYAVEAEQRLHGKYRA